ncbi:hypothetical protein D3C72_1540800 [compost metagenome]
MHHRYRGRRQSAVVRLAQDPGRQRPREPFADQRRAIAVAGAGAPDLPAGDLSPGRIDAVAASAAGLRRGLGSRRRHPRTDPRAAQCLRAAGARSHCRTTRLARCAGQPGPGATGTRRLRAARSLYPGCHPGRMVRAAFAGADSPLYGQAPAPGNRTGGVAGFHAIPVRLAACVERKPGSGRRGTASRRRAIGRLPCCRFSLGQRHPAGADQGLLADLAR